MQLSRSYSEEIRTRSYTACSTQAADGFAFVLYDSLTPVNASVIGEGGGGLGYAGLPNSVAIEFDTMGDPSLDEPAVAHVAVLSRGVRLASLPCPVTMSLLTRACSVAGATKRFVSSVQARCGTNREQHVHRWPGAHSACELHNAGAQRSQSRSVAA